MNIFCLDLDPKICAQYHCDKHVVKMILETAMLLSTATRNKSTRPVSGLYYRTYIYHPCTKWTYNSYENFQWLYELGKALSEEYEYRYEKEHKSKKIILASIHYMDATIKWDTSGITERPQCMPQIYKNTDCVTAYRNYYIGEKTYLLQYTRRPVPDWIANMGIGENK